MTILQSLDHYYGRMAVRGDVVAPGYSIEPIGFVVVLSLKGNVAAVEIRQDAAGKKPKPECVPKWFGRSGTGSTPYFLWDNTAYTVGVSTKDPGKTARDHAAFKALHLRELADETDEGLTALCHFLRVWTPDQFAAPLFTEKLLAWNAAFRLDGELRLLHERPAAAAHVERLRVGTNPADTVICLVTGQRAAPARLHRKIKGIDDKPGAPVEKSLVSFNDPAFESYGKEQGDNAPISEAAAFRYATALNRLLERGVSRNRISIGDATVAFWADASGAVTEAAAAQAEDFFARLVAADAANGAADDAGETRKLREALEKFTAGRPIEALGLGLMAGTRFHILGLAPNAARLSVRFWLEDRFEAFAERLRRHYEELAIVPLPWDAAKPPSIQRLLVKTTALQEKFENIPPLLAGETMRAVLGGTRYPRTLLIVAINRLRAGDDPGRGWHAAVVKAVINRVEKEKLPVALDPDNPHAAYQLGRLFAVLESAQYAALGRVNATIADRYYGAASATPARVFGALLRGLRTHVSDARKRGRGGWIEPKVNEIMNRLPSELPRTLRLEEQGRFAVGYYHERASRPPRATENVPAEETQDNA